MFLYCAYKSGISIAYISTITGISETTTRLVVRKIKAAQANRNEQIKIENAYASEIDTFYFGGKSTGKRGLGVENKACIAISVGKKLKETKNGSTQELTACEYPICS